jgi:hypothetical protein
MKVIFQAEINVDEVNPNYFCTDQTNINQELTTRNFYDSAQINLYIPNTNIVIGSSLYSSVDCQRSVDFTKVYQNLWSLLAVESEGVSGTFVVNYSVVDSEYITIPNISIVSSATGVFSAYAGYKVYITPSENNPTRILFIIYEN